MNNQNISYCLIAAIFVGASIYTMLSCKTCPPFVDYEQSLDKDQLKIYENIVKERKRIYISGFVIGTVIALGYLYANDLSLNPLKNSCVFVAIALVTQYFYYMFTPKSAHMITFMKNEDQLKKWLAVSESMKFKYHLGMLFGVIGYFAFAYGISKYSPYINSN